MFEKNRDVNRQRDNRPESGATFNRDAKRKDAFVPLPIDFCADNASIL